MDGLIVKKNTSLEHMTSFTLQERRFFAFCLQYYDSRPGADLPTQINIDLAAFKKAYPEYQSYYPNQIFDAIHTARHGINDKPYRWQENGKWMEEDWFTGHGVGPGEISVSLNRHPKILELFTNIKDRFIKYKMSDVGRLATPTAWTLYEFLKERFMNGTVPHWTMTVEDLRARLNVTDKYKIFADFDKRCLRAPIKEINKHTDLTVSYRKLKKGVRVAAVRFDVKSKAPDADTIDIEDLSVVFTREQLSHGISAQIAERNTKQAEKMGKLAECIAKVTSAHKSWKRAGKGPFSGYLAKVLSNYLFQREMFQESAAVSGADFSAYDDADLDVFLKSAPGYREDILREKRKRGLI
jgi:hypothetical protein